MLLSVTLLDVVVVGLDAATTAKADNDDVDDFDERNPADERKDAAK
jgi:hypothetical protein